MITRKNEGTDGEMPHTFSTSCRRTVTGAVLAGVLATGSLAVAAPARADEFLNFRNRATGRCLDSNGDGNVYTLPCNGGNFQMWRLSQVNSAYPNRFMIVDLATNRCLTSGWTTAVWTAQCEPSHVGQLWDYTAGNARWKVAASVGDTLDSNADGNVYLHPENGGPFQFWDH